MRKMSLLLLVIIIISTTACGGDRVKATKIESFDNVESIDVDMKKQEVDYDYYYTKSKNIVLRDKKSKKVRVLNLHERVGVIEEEGSKYHVVDSMNNKGYLNKSDLIKSFDQNIKKKYKGVLYDFFGLKQIVDSNGNGIKGIYIPLGKISDIDKILDSIEGTEINALVLDYKSDYGSILFDSEVAKKMVPKANNIWVKDKEAFMKKLKDKNLYLIARIVVFKSPFFADQYPETIITKTDGKPYYNHGTKWASPYDRKLWKYIYDLSNEAIEAGFDEIQYDYVRFPVINIKNVDLKNKNNETKTAAIQKFLMGAKTNLLDRGVIVSADVFGWSTTAIDDIGIGQQWESVSNVVDVISPMIYPSHYSRNIYGIRIPNKEPYKLVKYAVRDGIYRNTNLKSPASIRPWIQDFNDGYPYRQKEVNDQIKALKEKGIDTFLIWNPNGKYHLKFDKENEEQ